MNTTITVYDSLREKLDEVAYVYNKTTIALYRYLAYRDIPKLIAKYQIKKGSALDYGTGTGISAQFLIDQQFLVSAVDTSHKMLEQACLQYPSAKFCLVKNGSLPFPDRTFDFVFSSFVMFELEDRKAIIQYLKEARRVLKPTGVFIGITGSEDMYTRDWLCFKTDFPENKNLSSGCKAKILLTEEGIEFIDVYWKMTDYESFFQEAQMEIMERFFPLGKPDEPFLWKDEKMRSPYVIFVAKPV